MFRDKSQAARVCFTLCALAGVEKGWSRSGPEPFAFTVRRAKDGLPTRERILVRVAWALWSREGEVKVADLLDLDPPRLAIVCALLVAVTTSPDHVDAWLAERTAEWQAERARTAAGAA